MKRLYLMTAAVSLTGMRAFMSDACETVTVKGQDGEPLRINKTDYDADQADGGAKKFKLHKDDAAAPDPVTLAAGQSITPPADVIIPPAPSAPAFVTPVPPQVPSPGQFLVFNEGKKYFIVDVQGVKVTGNPGVDEKGYASEQAALDAIKLIAGTTNTLAQ